MPIFIENKYTKWYNNIISNAIKQERIGYTEKHHIIPRSLGGSDLPENLVRLTAKEHYICHLLLTKMLPEGNLWRKMCHALIRMMVSSKNHKRIKYHSRQYESAKKLLSKARTGVKHTSEARKKMSMSQKGKPGRNNNQNKHWYNNGDNHILCYEHKCPPGYVVGRLEKTIEKHSRLLRGKKFSEQHRKNISKSKSGIHVPYRNVGKKMFTNGITTIYAVECPEGYYPGRTMKSPSGKKWFNDGFKSYMYHEKDCPEGLVPGRLFKNR